MITLEQAKAQGIVIVGTEPKPYFIVGSKSDNNSYKYAPLTRKIQNAFNKQLKISDYSSVIERITIVILLLPPYNGLGVDWKERKYFSRKEKHFYMDLKISDYNAFCNATPQQAVEMLKTEILRGIEAYLSKVKGFDAKKFSEDFVQLD